MVNLKVIVKGLFGLKIVKVERGNFIKLIVIFVDLIGFIRVVFWEEWVDFV